MNPKVTVITSTYNCVDALIVTALSIREQSSPNLQWIVADGGSVDGTVDVIKENLDIVDNWFSGQDNGIYDAWNKALEFVRGEWVLFMGAGDTFFHKDALTDFFKIAPSDCLRHSIIYGNVLYVRPDGRARYVSRKPNLNYWEFGRPALPHHQGVFHNTRLFETLRFDTSYKIAADSKFVLEAMKSNTYVHVDITIAKMCDDGISNDIRSVPMANAEIKRLCRELGIPRPLMYKLRSDLKIGLLRMAHKSLPVDFLKALKKFADRLHGDN